MGLKFKEQYQQCTTHGQNAEEIAPTMQKIPNLQPTMWNRHTHGQKRLKTMNIGRNIWNLRTSRPNRARNAGKEPKLAANGWKCCNLAGNSKNTIPTAENGWKKRKIGTIEAQNRECKQEIRRKNAWNQRKRAGRWGGRQTAARAWRNHSKTLNSRFWKF